MQKVAAELGDELREVKALAEGRLQEIDRVQHDLDKARAELRDSQLRLLQQPAARSNLENLEGLLKQRELELEELGNMVAALRFENLTLEDRFSKEVASSQVCLLLSHQSACL